MNEAGELNGSWEYNADIFERSTIERAVGHYLKLLEEAADDPEKSIGSLQMLTEPERRQIFQEWNNPQVRFAKSGCIHQAFEAQANSTRRLRL